MCLICLSTQHKSKTVNFVIYLFIEKMFLFLDEFHEQDAACLLNSIGGWYVVSLCTARRAVSPLLPAFMLS